MILAQTLFLIGCTGDVIDITSSHAVTLTAYDLYGCGIRGVTVVAASDIVLQDCIIRECYDSAVYISNSQDVSFLGTDIRDNATEDSYQQYLVLLESDCANITFQGCTIHDNGTAESAAMQTTTLFCLDETEEAALTVVDCQIDNNHYTEYLLKFEDLV